jgi:UPF0271 protein
MTGLQIDINADAGESFGRWALGDDAEFLRHVSSVNIACGYHAGDPVNMRATLKLARDYNIAAGAHPGLPDLLGFGRRVLAADRGELVDYCLYQIGALEALARDIGIGLRHVKPHGALYKMCADDPELSTALAQAIRRYDPQMWLVLIDGPGADAAEATGVRIAREAFIDLNYDEDGNLIVERQPAGIEPGTVAQRARRVVESGELGLLGGGTRRVRAMTLCLHGDRSNSTEVARTVKAALVSAGIAMRPMHAQVHK